jgi:hypothetical protein
MQPHGGGSRAAIEKKSDRAAGDILFLFLDIGDKEHVCFGLSRLILQLKETCRSDIVQDLAASEQCVTGYGKLLLHRRFLRSARCDG